jgi:nitronate monooxygenase
MAKPTLTEILDIQYPIIMAPMFLVSNTAMVKEALDSGITGCIPALNYRTIPELRDAIREIKAHSNKPFGINLIVNKSNIYYEKQLEACVEEGVDFFITSLGSPKKTIQMSKPKGIKVFCDVVNVEMAKKCEGLGADGIIAVNSEAGGHSGKIDGKELIPMINDAVSIPVISAGGVATYDQFQERMSWGAAGCSVGTIFIASNEAPVSQDYKQACVDYGAKDIVHTTKLSGTPCTVINTPYVQKVGTKQNLMEKLMHTNKFFKKYIKMFISWQGITSLKKAAFNSTYKTVWCAGPTIEDVHAIRPVKEIVKSLTTSS